MAGWTEVPRWGRVVAVGVLCQCRVGRFGTEGGRETGTDEKTGVGCNAKRVVFVTIATAIEALRAQEQGEIKNYEE